MRLTAAFTLIELLVSVAIISILALIAVPMLSEAKVRSNVSRVRADFTTMRTAVHAYRVDQNRYPRMSELARDVYVWPGGRQEPIGGTLGPWI
ncbi:prepilin-type N-terminal cleavage/methylation domain-containing protein, partial [Candidatus Poribacteria bacterium]|nr:prepilin-type N-terminal cleavage/methylation domain-containing protein [Candidatus Poribacteria bacterium]